MATAICKTGGAAFAPPPTLEAGSEPTRLEVFTSFPPWGMAFAAKDNLNAPLIRKGEVVVVQTDGRTGHIPKDGGLYLIEYESRSLIEQCPHFTPTPDRLRRPRSWQIIEARRTVRRDGAEVWWATSRRAPRSTEEAERQMQNSRYLIASDGPYRDEYHLAEQILGPVVGIYNPHPLPVRA